MYLLKIALASSFLRVHKVHRAAVSAQVSFGLSAPFTHELARRRDADVQKWNILFGEIGQYARAPLLRHVGHRLRKCRCMDRSFRHRRGDFRQAAELHQRHILDRFKTIFRQEHANPDVA